MPDETVLSASATESLPEADELALPEPELEPLPEGGVEALSAGELESQAKQAEEFGEQLTAIQNIVERYGNQLDELNKKIRDLRESLSNLFENNEELQEAEAQQKALKTDVTAKKQRIKESPEAVQFQMKIKELAEEANEVKQTVSNHLIRYYQMTGSQVIETSSGEEREFSVSARLKGKKKTD
jgi:DNA-binding transcriptional MerR regulator